MKASRFTHNFVKFPMMRANKGQFGRLKETCGCETKKQCNNEHNN